MDRTLQFRRDLAGRLLRIAALSLPPVAFAMASCGSQTETNGPGGGGGAGMSGPSTSSATSGTDVVASSGPGDDGSFIGEECFAWPQPGTGGGGGAGGMNGAGGAGGTGMPPCPSKDDALQYIMTTCGGQVGSEAITKDGQCCYSVYHNGCGVGRPFLENGAPRAAAPRRAERGGGPGAAADRGWIDESLLLPSVGGLSRGDRARLAEAWARDGLFEHASIASFGRFALELMATGAPADLIDLAHRAALDEVRHAKLCLGLASAYAGEVIEPSRFPFGGRVAISDDLADVAARAVIEGCVGETIAAIQAAEQLARSTDPAVRAVLAAIADDEARHAELAWRAVAWGCRAGGERVQRAVAEAFEGALASASAASEGQTDGDPLEAHGLLSQAARRAIAARALGDVIRPAARTLLPEKA